MQLQQKLTGLLYMTHYVRQATIHFGIRYFWVKFSYYNVSLLQILIQSHGWFLTG